MVSHGAVSPWSGRAPPRERLVVPPQACLELVPPAGRKETGGGGSRGKFAF
jgi:hypothetical protein